LGIIPIVRAGGDEDFARSAAARLMAEGLLWTPASFLPCAEAVWKAVDDETAIVSVEHQGEQQSIHLTVEGDGRPRSLVIQRWSKENPDKEWRLQPLGAEVKEIRAFGNAGWLRWLRQATSLARPTTFPSIARR
jgi:hypothetical protein